MRKLIQKITVISLLTLLFSISTCYGATGQDYVRVRVRSPRIFNEQSSLEGYENITVYEIDGSPDELFTLDDNKISVLLDSYFDGNFNYVDKSKASYGPNHVILDDLYTSYDDANKVAEDLEEIFNEDFYPQLNREGFKIYGGNYSSIKEADNLMSQLNDEGYNAKSVISDMKNIIIYDEYNNALFMYANDMNIYFATYNDQESCEMIIIDGKPFRGYMGFKIIESSKLISINYVELEKYLYGVVPNEISASWGMESLKAQAVAARTYAVSCISPNASYGYDMDDNQNSQVYRGYSSEKKSTTEAVDETKGEMIYYNDKLIKAFYHSTSGGSTENSENVWMDKLPYLVGVEDEFSDRSGSPYNEWQKSYQKNEIIKKLNDDGHDVNELYGIEISKVSKNNRVMECIFLTDNGEIVYYKEQARLLLGLMSSWFKIENGSVFYFTNEFTYDNNKDSEKDSVPSKGGILDSITEEEQEAKETNESTDTVIKLDSGSVTGKYVITANGTQKLTQDKISVISSKGVSVLETNSSDYNFQGRGWGHGIGMSQYGAKQMAAEGYTYNEILEHYYTGVIIK